MSFRQLIITVFRDLFIFIMTIHAVNLEGTWSTPVAISATTSDQPDIAVDISGNALAVWQGFDGNNYVIQASSFSVGGMWSTPTTLSSSGQNAQNPEVSVDSSGNGISVWSRYNGDSSIIQASSLTFRGSWSTSIDISSAGSNADSQELSMARTGTVGNAIVSWHQYNGSNFVVQSSALPSGGSWSIPETLTPSGQDALIPEIVVDASGNAAAACCQYNGTNFTTRASTKLLGYSWNAGFIISNSSSNVSQPFLATDLSGNVICVWNQFNGSNYIITSATLPFGGSWSTPMSVSAIGSDAYIPQIAIDGNGNAIALWNRFDGTNYTAQAARLPAGGSWSTPVTLSASGYNVGFVSLKVDAAGNATALWDAINAGNSTIQTAALPVNGNWSSAIDISTPGQYAYFPVLDVDAAGNVVAIWLESTATYDVLVGATKTFGS